MYIIYFDISGIRVLNVNKKLSYQNYAKLTNLLLTNYKHNVYVYIYIYIYICYIYMLYISHHE